MANNTLHLRVNESYFTEILNYASIFYKDVVMSVVSKCACLVRLLYCEHFYRVDLKNSNNEHFNHSNEHKLSYHTCPS